MAASREDGHPPLYATLLHFWMEAFGESEAAVRSLSALVGVVTLGALFLTARRLMAERDAVVATLLLACSPYHVYYSQEARNYALFLLLTVASYGLLLAWSAGGRRAAAGYVAATTLLVYTHVFGFFVWAAQLLWLAFEWRRTRRRPRTRDALPMMAIAVLALVWLLGPWTATLWHQVGPHTGLRLSRPTVMSLLRSLEDFAGATGAALVLLPAAALEVYRGLRDAEARARTVLLVLWAAVPQLAPFALSQVTVPIYITRATIATLPALVLLAAAFLGRLGTIARGLLVATVVLSALVAQVLYFRFPSKEQWREVAAAVDARARPGDVAVFDAYYGQRGFDHYSRAALASKVSLADDLVSPEGARELEAMPPDAPRVWVIRFQRPPARDRVSQALGPRFRLAGFAAYQGVELYLFERRAAGPAPASAAASSTSSGRPGPASPRP